MKKTSGQTVPFPTLADAPATSAKVKFAAFSSSGLPVECFVLMGPRIIENGAFVPLEAPKRLSKLIKVTVKAFQLGLFQDKVA